MRTNVLSLAAAAVVAAVAGSSSGAVAYNTNVLPATPNLLVGTGIPNIGFVTDTQNNAQTGLSAIYRFLGGQNYISNNEYGVDSGLSTFPPAGVATWNYLLAANLDIDGTSGRNLGNTDVFLTIDWDPSAGTDLRTYNYGAAALAAGAPTTTTVLQDSQNLAFSFWSDMTFLALTGSTAPSVSFNPFAEGRYDFTLRIQTQGASPTVLSEVSSVVVVPAPASAAMLGLGGLLASRRRR